MAKHRVLFEIRSQLWTMPPFPYNVLYWEFWVSVFNWLFVHMSEFSNPFVRRHILLCSMCVLYKKKDHYVWHQKQMRKRVKKGKDPMKMMKQYWILNHQAPRQITPASSICHQTGYKVVFRTPQEADDTTSCPRQQLMPGARLTLLSPPWINSNILLGCLYRINRSMKKPLIPRSTDHY